MLFQLLTQKVIGGLLVVFALGLTISNVSEQFGGSNGTSQNNYAQINGSGSGMGSGGEVCADWGSASSPSTTKSTSTLSAQGGDAVCETLVAAVLATIPKPPVPGACVKCKCVDSPGSSSCTGNCPRSLYPTTTEYQHWVVDPFHPAPSSPPTVTCPTTSTPQSCDHVSSVAVDCVVGAGALGKCCGKSLHFGKEYCSEHALYCVPPASPSASPTPSASGADSTGSGSGPSGSGSGTTGSGSGPSGSGHSFNRGEPNNYYASLARINRFVD